MTTKLSRNPRLLVLWGTAVFLALIGLTQSTHTALAHTRVEVGPYAFVIGWLQEPPIVGERNALTLEVTKDEQPLSGAEATLDVEVLYAGRTWRVNMNPTETPGLYTAVLFPTVRGTYTTRIFGTLEDTEIDVELDPEEVLPANTLQFPQPLPDTIALQEQVDQLQTELQTARTWSFIGVAGGGLGILLGLVGLLRRKSS
ncbi:MAG: hypothetical protein H6656_21945 [Ardenticatenaceae bacterium]|nr:hypothetical protein [Anaerolineales bacterium]MCB9009998.1 hypothetical protein [Ardenticatenaceae bacterium]